MDPLDEFEEENTDTVFRDVILLTLVGFVAMVIMLLPHLQEKKQQQAEDHKTPGNVIVEMHWPDDMNVDVDLWVKGPNSTPVGFWNQGNDVFNLLRDDLGQEGDATNRNYEVSYSRGIVPGEYVVNVHMYSIIPSSTPVVPVTVVVSVRTRYDTTRQLLETSIDLTRRNQEETAYRFRLDADGGLIEGSVSTLRYPLITGRRRLGN